jgi:hypothetical protein
MATNSTADQCTSLASAMPMISDNDDEFFVKKQRR